MNKLFLGIIALLSIFFVACKISSPSVKVPQRDETLGEIEGTIVFNPRTGGYDTLYTRNNRIDTVSWRPAPSKTTPPIGETSTTSTAPTKPNNTNSNNTIPIDYAKNNMPTNIKAPAGTKMKSSYNLTYLLPFFTDKYSDLDKELYEKSAWAMHFYAGAQMALDTLSTENINLKIGVLDTRASENQMALALASEYAQNADLLIGTETNATVKLAADFAKLNKKVMISPYNPSADLVYDNPQFVQINPSLRTNCEAIVRHLRKKYRPEQVVVICRDKTNEREALQYLQNENIRLSTGSTTRFREMIIDEKAGMVAVDIKGSMTSENMVYIVPIWGQNTETFVYSLLNKINTNKGKRNVTVYGMPQWASFQVNGYDAFEPLNVHITQPAFIDKLGNAAAKGFAINYYNTYNAAPNDEAYMGYDLTLYAGRMLHRYGTKFNEVLDQVPFTGLHTSFNFERERSNTATYNDAKVNFDRFANKYVNILKFEQGSFNLIKE